jgi:hypothetical protein
VTVFIDHYSRFSFVYLQQQLSSEETVKAKAAFEAYSRSVGVKKLVPSDQLESTTRPRLISQLKGRATRRRYRRVMVFIDHYSLFSFVCPQQQLSLEKTVKVMTGFESYSRLVRNKDGQYHADSGRLTENGFLTAAAESNQSTFLGRVNAHSPARTQIRHTTHKWTNMTDKHQWPYAPMPAIDPSTLGNNAPSFEGDNASSSKGDTERVSEGAVILVSNEGETPPPGSVTNEEILPPEQPVPTPSVAPPPKHSPPAPPTVSRSGCTVRPQLPSPAVDGLYKEILPIEQPAPHPGSPAPPTVDEEQSESPQHSPPATETVGKSGWDSKAPKWLTSTLFGQPPICSQWKELRNLRGRHASANTNIKSPVLEGASQPTQEPPVLMGASQLPTLEGASQPTFEGASQLQTIEKVEQRPLSEGAVVPTVDEGEPLPPDDDHWEPTKKKMVPEGETTLPTILAIMKRKKQIVTKNTYKWKSQLNQGGHNKVVAERHYSEYYVPLPARSTIRLFLILAILHRWKTRRIESVNACLQAPAPREKFTELAKSVPLNQLQLINSNQKDLTLLDMDGNQQPSPRTKNNPSQPTELARTDMDGATFSAYCECCWNMIEKLNFPGQTTQDSILYQVHQCNQPMSEPREDSHSVANRQIGRYLLPAMRERVIISKPNPNKPFGCFINTELSADPDATRYLTECCNDKYKVGDPYCWSSKLISQVAIMALNLATRQLKSIMYLLEQLDGTYFRSVSTPNIHRNKPFEENSAVLKIARATKVQPRTRHINASCHRYDSTSPRGASLSFQSYPKIGRQACSLTPVNSRSLRSIASQTSVGNHSLDHIKRGSVSCAGADRRPARYGVYDSHTDRYTFSANTSDHILYTTLHVPLSFISNSIHATIVFIIQTGDPHGRHQRSRHRDLANGRDRVDVHQFTI